MNLEKIALCVEAFVACGLRPAEAENLVYSTSNPERTLQRFRPGASSGR